VAIGRGAVASGSTAVGGAAQATGANSAAFGADAATTGDNSTALGEQSLASGTGSTALGEGARATQSNAMALGAGAQSTAANQVMIGTAANTYTLPGIASAASRTAQVGPVELVTTDAQGNLATDGGAFTGGVGTSLSRLDKQIRENRDGIAMALALQSPSLAGAESYAFSAGWGGFDGGSAFAASGAVRIAPGAQLDGGIGIGLRENTLGGRLGVTFKW